MTSDDTRWVAAYGIDDRQRQAGALDTESWTTLFTEVCAHKLNGLLHEAIVDGAFHVTELQRHQATEVQCQLMERALKLDRLLLEVHEMLDVAGIEHRVIKGFAHAALLYPDPALRPYGDLDLLIPAHQIDEAIRVLGDGGVKRIKPELRPGFDRRFGKGATLRSEHWWGVDIHRTFAVGPFAMTIDADRLFESDSSLPLGSASLQVLDVTGQFLNACFSAAISDVRPTLITLRDVVQATLDPSLDRERALELAASWRAGAVVARAVTLAWNELGLRQSDPIVDWAQRYQPDRRERRYVEAYLSEEQRWAREALAALPAVPGLRPKFDYLLAITFPTKQAANRRGRTRRERLRRGIGLISRSGRPG